ncbi:MAG: hypothetical protein ACFFDF_15620 [Candidatus Odinarchaeota archaeon]
MKKKIVTSRPTCKKCGNKIYIIKQNYYRGWGGKMPKHCPECGEKLTEDQKEQLMYYRGLGFLVSSVVVIVVCAVLIIVLNIYS